MHKHLFRSVDTSTNDTFVIQFFFAALFKTGLSLVGWLIWTFAEYMIASAIIKKQSRPGKLSILLNITIIRIGNAQGTLLILISLISTVTAFWLNRNLFLLSGFIRGVTLYGLMHYILHQRWSARLPRLHYNHIYHQDYCYCKKLSKSGMPDPPGRLCFKAHFLARLIAMAIASPSSIFFSISNAFAISMALSLTGSGRFLIEPG